jgi:hypothetical protein
MNTVELKITCEQLARARSVLKSLEADILPVSQQMYDIMSEPCVEIVNELKGKLRSNCNGFCGEHECKMYQEVCPAICNRLNN